MEGYWFRSTRFQIVEGEVLDTGPGIYGRQLAYWLRDGLIEAGYRSAEVEPENWGWCIVVARRPHLLWVGCGGTVHNEGGSGADGAAPARGNAEVRGEVRGDALLWHCHAAVERSWLMGWWGRAAAANAVRDLDLALRRLLLADPDIQLVDPQ